MISIHRALLLSLLLPLAGCGPDEGPEEPGEGTSRDVLEVDVCALLPASDLQPIVEPIADGRMLGAGRTAVQGCTWRIDPVGQLPAVGVYVDYGYHLSAENARGSIDAAHAHAVSANLTNIEWLEGFGDHAFISEQGAAVGIKLSRGRIAMQVNVNKFDAGFDTLSPVVRALTARALEKMPVRD